MAKTAGFTDFFALFKHLKKQHLFALVADTLFVALFVAGSWLFMKLQLIMAARFQALNLANMLTNAGQVAVQATQAKSIALQLLGSLILFAIFVLLCWILTRALVWKFLIGLPRGVSFFKLWLKLIIPNIIWLLITIVPLYFALFNLARLYENPIVQIASQPAGYAYIFFLYLIVAVLVLAYCHLTNIFYLTYFKTPRFRAVWDALKEGIGNFPRWAKPLGVMSIFFVVTIVVSLVAMPLPEPFKTTLSFGFLFFFALVSRMWYVVASR